MRHIKDAENYEILKAKAMTCPDNSINLENSVLFYNSWITRNDKQVKRKEV